MKERFFQYIAHRGMTPYTFEQYCGITKGLVAKMVNGIRSDILAKIALACPDLNVRWLLTGEGEMLTRPELPTTGNPVSHEAVTPNIDTDQIAWLRARVEAYEKQVARLLDQKGEVSQSINL